MASSASQLMARVIFLALVFLPHVAAWPRSYIQFQTWYPEFGPIFQKILDTNCTTEYNVYLYGTEANVTIPWDNGGGQYTLFIQPVVQCLLNYTNEYTKTSMGMSQLILGLAPTILAFTGASSVETSLVAVIGKRPLIASILALASPSIYISRAFEYDDPRDCLSDSQGRYRHKWDSHSTGLRRTWAGGIVAVEYVLAFACLANVATLDWQLGVQAIAFVTPSFIFHPMCWSILGIVVHGIGFVILRFRARRSNEDGSSPPAPTLLQWIYRALTFEFALLGQQHNNLDGKEVFIQWFDEDVKFLALSWLHSVCSIGHLVYGTLIFSGIMFVGPLDAFIIWARYMASSLGCRLILRYELAGLREAYNAGLKRNAHQPDHKHCEHMKECFDCGGEKPDDSYQKEEISSTPYHQYTTMENSLMPTFQYTTVEGSSMPNYQYTTSEGASTPMYQLTAVEGSSTPTYEYTTVSRKTY